MRIYALIVGNAYKFTYILLHLDGILYKPAFLKHAMKEQKLLLEYEVYVKNFTNAMLNYLHMKIIIRIGFAS